MKYVLALVTALFSLMALPAMADNVYPAWKAQLMSGNANAAVATCDLRAILVDAADYTIWADNFGSGNLPAGVTLERGAVFRAMPTANRLEVYAEVEVELFKKWHVRFRELTWELPELSGPRRADEST